VKRPVLAPAGRVGSAFAAELGTMSVSEQTDSLRVLGSDPVDYLVIPRVLACAIAGPILNLMCFCMGAPETGPTPHPLEQPQQPHQ
jgi:ABC-type transporter Mla maintaining outer membrane lipid asymmetry permease subunit MlaE